MQRSDQVASGWWLARYPNDCGDDGNRVHANTGYRRIILTSSFIDTHEDNPKVAQYAPICQCDTHGVDRSHARIYTQYTGIY